MQIDKVIRKSLNSELLLNNYYWLYTKIRTVEANLKDEKEKNAQLEALILAMTSKLEMFHSLASSFLDMEAAKVIIRYRLFLWSH